MSGNGGTLRTPQTATIAFLHGFDRVRCYPDVDLLQVCPQALLQLDEEQPVFGLIEDVHEHSERVMWKAFVYQRTRLKHGS
jgi:hypothetical protein